MTALEAYILARAYAKALVEGAGSLKGAACQIKSIEAITGGHRITFEWEDNDGEVSTDTMDVMDGADGSDGVGISSITYKETDAHGNYVYTVTLSDTNTYDIICPKGTQGETGETGATGNGIASIAKTSTEGLVDTYTITYTNGQTTTFTVTNGESITVDSAMSGSSTNPVQNKVITEALALKQDAMDDSLETTDKTIVGAINEHEGDIGTLKSGLTNLDNEVNGDATVYPYADVITIPDAVPSNLADCTVKIEPVQDLHGYDKPWVGGAGKNKLPMTVDSIKALNTTGTWSDNVYTINNMTFTIIVDGNNNVIGIKANDTPNTDTTLKIAEDTILVAGSYIMSGCASGGSWSNSYGLNFRYDGEAHVDTGSGRDITITNETIQTRVEIMVRSGYQASNVTFQPMIRLATESDATFAPYTNICPITGHTEVDVQRYGKNLCGELEQGGFDASGLNDTSTQRVRTRYYIPVIEGQQYVLYTEPTASGATVNLSAQFYSKNDYATPRVADSGWLSNGSTITIPSGIKYIRCALRYIDNRVVTVSSFDNTQIELGSTVTPYEPYAGKTYTIALGDTIYGGTVDFDSGVMTVDRVIAEYDGSSDESWVLSGSGTDTFYYQCGVALNTDRQSISNMFIRYGTTDFNTGVVGFCITNNGFVRVRTPQEMTVEDFNTWLSNNNLQLCYKLATPTTIQLTPQQIQLLKGTNTLTASTGQISVTVNGVSGAIGSVQEQVNELVDCIGWGRNVNLLQIKFNALKSLNTNGTWNDNVYSYNGVNYTFNVDDYGNVYRITANGTATPSNSYVYLFELDNTMKYSGDIYSCLTTAGSNTTFRSAIDEMVSPYTRLTIDEGNGDIVRETDKSVRCWITVYAGYKATNVQFEPMIRDSSVTNTTYEPYHPVIGTAVEELLEKVPDAPTTDGAYVLTVTVADGTPTYSWESAT